MKAAQLIVLGIALSAGGLAAFLAAGNDAAAPPPVAPVAQLDTTEILVAKSDINIGTAIAAQDMAWQAWPTEAASSVFVRKNERPDAIEQLAGSIVRVPIAAGEPVREAKLIKAKGSGYMAAILPSGMRAVSTEISPETGAGGFILPNDRVDVMLSRRDREAERASGSEAFISETILNDVRILAIDQSVEEKNGQRVVVGKTATLELAPRQAETLALARQMGTLSLALRSLLDGDRPKAGEGEDRSLSASAGRVNMVRFGVTTTTVPK